MEFLFGTRNFFVCPSVLFNCFSFNFIVVMSLKITKYLETSITDVALLFSFIFWRILSVSCCDCTNIGLANVIVTIINKFKMSYSRSIRTRSIYVIRSRLSARTSWMKQLHFTANSSYYKWTKWRPLIVLNHNVSYSIIKFKIRHGFWVISGAMRTLVSGFETKPVFIAN